jgi:hypothetical protein
MKFFRTSRHLPTLSLLAEYENEFCLVEVLHKNDFEA